ncbi:signal peptidase II [bacterium]|nr:signal peptidase II [bacterium]
MFLLNVFNRSYQTLNYVMFFFVFLIIDQTTKQLIVDSFQIHETINLIPDFLNLTHVRNPGAAFGVFSDYSPRFRQLVLSAVLLVALSIVIKMFLQDFKQDKLGRYALVLIFSGAIGNIIDRARYGAVIDFIDVFYGDYHWPAFNVADSCIFLGVLTISLKMLFTPKTKESELIA